MIVLFSSLWVKSHSFIRGVSFTNFQRDWLWCCFDLCFTRISWLCCWTFFFPPNNFLVKKQILQVLLITRFLQHEHHLGRPINQVNSFFPFFFISVQLLDILSIYLLTSLLIIGKLHLFYISNYYYLFYTFILYTKRLLFFILFYSSIAWEHICIYIYTLLRWIYVFSPYKKKVSVFAWETNWCRIKKTK